MLIVILIIAGILYFVSGTGCSERKNSQNYKLLFAAVICSVLTLATAGKRAEMTAMFVIVSIGLWIAFAYDKHLKKNLAQGGQYLEHVSGTCVSMPLHPYGTEKIFKDAQEAYGNDGSIKWLKKEDDNKLPENQMCSTNVQVVKKYYIFGKNIYISDTGVEKSTDKWE